MTSPVMSSPRAIEIEITARCNLRCRYCYFFDNPGVEYRDLPTREWLRFFGELGSLGVMSVVLAGGEPFIREDLAALLDGIVRNRMRFSILSNGSLITDDAAAHIARTGRCDFVQVSVDGSRPETHDSCRGKGSFEGAIRGIRILKRHGVPVTARLTVHKRNLDDLEATARFLLEELGLPDLSTNAAGSLGSCRESGKTVLLDAGERSRAMAALVRAADRYPGRITGMAGPLADAQMWGRMEKARREGAPPFPEGGRLSGCGCPHSKMGVRADGVMVPCLLLGGIELGRVNQDSLAAAWREGSGIVALRGRSATSLAGFEFCKGCQYIPYCTGNCPGLALSLTGREDHPSPDSCLRRFLDEGGTLP